MKNVNRWFATVAILAVCGVAPAFAQLNAIVKADVPFNFVVRGKTLPAGEYKIIETANPAVLIVRHVGGEESVAVLTNWSSNGQFYDQTKLVFRVVGDDHYYLAAVQAAGEQFGHAIPKTAAEREAEWAGTKVVLASVKAVRQQ